MKPIWLYKQAPHWIVYSRWARRMTYCADFGDACAVMEIELLERLVDV